MCIWTFWSDLWLEDVDFCLVVKDFVCVGHQNSFIFMYYIMFVFRLNHLKCLIESNPIQSQLKGRFSII